MQTSRALWASCPAQMRYWKAGKNCSQVVTAWFNSPSHCVSLRPSPLTISVFRNKTAPSPDQISKCPSHNCSLICAIRSQTSFLFAVGTFVSRTQARCSPPKSERQLYNLVADPGERNNVLHQHSEVAQKLHEQITEIVLNGRSTTGPKQANDTPWWNHLIWMDKF